ncbi:hypothetical protein EQG64_04740 [Streptomyces sp. S6]|nr:hypothetical protein EQG64_04740 [Streptomyces sp. S6]
MGLVGGAGGGRARLGACGGGACGGPVPLPAPSETGLCPDPAPQAPEGWWGGALAQAPLLKRRRGWWGVGRWLGPRSSSVGGAGGGGALPLTPLPKRRRG